MRMLSSRVISIAESTDSTCVTAAPVQWTLQLLVSVKMLLVISNKICQLLWLRIAATYAGSVYIDVLHKGLHWHYFVMGTSFFVLGSSCFRKGIKLNLPGINGCNASGTLHTYT